MHACVNVIYVHYPRGKVFYLKCRLPEALNVYSDAAALARDQREVEHIILYEKGISTNQTAYI